MKYFRRYHFEEKIVQIPKMLWIEKVRKTYPNAEQLANEETSLRTALAYYWTKSV